MSSVKQTQKTSSRNILHYEYPQYIWIVLGGSSHLVSGLVHPNYKWINPTYPM